MAAPRDLNWKDLVPLKARGAPQPGVLSHSIVPSSSFSDPRHFAIVPELNGEFVRLPGFLVPLKFDGTGGTEFLLVPFVGACIHVPPPPPNQLVYALAERPHQMEGLFAPVYAVGTLRTVYAETGLAQASYQMNVQTFEDVSL
ncbi:MAG: DUF3299 domain-containing protein [Rhodobacteraceae bacterium]|nr:DUF3299 domain-containing protein [Paracoccaceae bacterium]